MVDVSRSMATGDGGKLRHAKLMAAVLAYVGLVRLETITLIPFDEALGETFICSGGRHRFAQAAAFLGKLTPGGMTRYLEVVREVSSRYLQRGLLIVISDFLGTEDGVRPLQLLADSGHELLLVQVWDEEDRSPPWHGELGLVDAESGVRREIDFDAGARERYTMAFDAHAAVLQRVAVSSGGRYAGLPTTVPVEDAIFGPLAVALKV
jgi:hypothetical protein